MSQKDLFQDNLKRWAVSCPVGAGLISALGSNEGISKVQFCQSASGAANLVVEVDGLRKYVHSQTDPVEEAKQWFLGLRLDQTQVIYVYGVGLGYYYEAAREWLKADEGRLLVFLEDDLQVMRRFLGTERGHEMLFDRRVLINFLPAGNASIENLNEFVLMLANYRFVFTGLTSYVEGKHEMYSEIKSEVSFLSKLHQMWLCEVLTTYDSCFIRNYFLSILNLSESYFADRLRGQFKDMPAIICGAGPSLNKNIDVLATLTDRALLFGGGTAMNALNGKGVMPSFGAGIDPNPDQFTRLIMNCAYETPFFWRGRMLTEALDMVHGERLFVSSGQKTSIARWLEESLGIKGLDLSDGFNVLNFTTTLAHFLGCNPIICVGIDLAYSDGHSYASGIVSHPIHDRGENFRTKQLDEDLLSKPDIYGNPVFTLWKWVAESGWYSDFAQKNPDVLLINATEGGIGFPGVQNMTLAEVRDKYLTKQYDIPTRLHGEIQASRFPAEVNRGSIKEKMREMADSLFSSGDICQLLFDLWERKGTLVAEDTSLDGKIEDCTNRLLLEVAYKAVLNEFQEAYRYAIALPLLQQRLDEGIVSAQETHSKMSTLQAEQYRHMKDCAMINANIIELVLTKHEGANSSGKDNAIESNRESPLPKPTAVDIYQFDEKKFVIVDPEMGLNYAEDLTRLPLSKAIKKEFVSYPSGAPKLQWHTKNGVYHGPSIFFHEDGRKLAQVWFIEGKQEGKMWTYYFQGPLHSVQRFRNGVKEGLQQFFYPSGTVKSLLNFGSGVLQGDVVLYYPGGQLFRRLNFDHGKRMGLEQLWNKEGQLIIETHYDADCPVGLTKKWHPNGVLAEEILYDEAGQRTEFRSWDTNGDSLEIRQDSKDDYFDKVNQRTDVLTAALDDVVGKLSLISPLFSQLSYKESPPLLPGNKAQSNPEAELAVQLELLKTEMQHLKDIEAAFKSQVSDDKENFKESLWKNPLSRQKISEQVEDLNTQMTRDMLLIQEGIKKVISTFSDKDNNEKKET